MTRKHAPDGITTVVLAGKDLNQACNGFVTSTEQSAAIEAGGATLGPLGGGTVTAPPCSAAGGGIVVVDDEEADVVVVERLCGTDVGPCADGRLGELEQAAAPSGSTSAVSPSAR